MRKYSICYLPPIARAAVYSIIEANDGFEYIKRDEYKYTMKEWAAFIDRYDRTTVDIKNELFPYLFGQEELTNA